MSKPIAFVLALEEFLKQVESDPFDIDTSIFDRDRAQESEREVEERSRVCAVSVKTVEIVEEMEQSGEI